MDYSLSEALKQTAQGLNHVFVMYDIMRQYGIHLRERLREGPYLALPWKATIHECIGVWQVHGHIESCWPRYSPTLVPGAEHVDGEILETTWSELNPASGSTRGMSAAHRQETLDGQMRDSNWQKILNIGEPGSPSVIHPWL